MTILTVTMNPALDVSGSVEAVVPEDKLRLADVRYEPGGGGINVARAARELGSEAVAVFPAGGATGRKVAELLRGEGVDHQTVEIDGSTRQSLTVSETGSRRQFRFVMPGPRLTEDEVERCFRAVAAVERSPDLLVISGSMPDGVADDFIARLADAGRERGARVIVDASGPSLARAVEAGVFLVKPNLREFLDLVGGQADHIDASLAGSALDRLRETGTEALVVSVGVGGALLATGGRAVRFASPVVPIQSRVGAGDSMVAGIAVALARGDSLDEAIRLGVAAGAAAVMTPGSALCRRADVERLYDQLRDQPPAVLVAGSD